MRLGLRMGLNSRQGGGGALDPDARAYIAEVEIALGTPIATALPSATADPKRIISDFIKAEKAASRWALHKRIFLPIYNNAAASAIDMVDLNVGTFVGGVTHAAGYVNGDGTSGYFNLGVSASTLGLTPSAGGFTVLAKAADTRTDFRCLLGASQAGGATENYLASNSSADLRFSYNTFPTSVLGSLVRTSHNGIISADREGGALRIRRRSSAGVASIYSATRGDAGSVSIINLFMGALNNGGSPLYFSNAEIGVGCVDSGFSATYRDAFTYNLKTLYEGLTGITLP